MTSNGDQQPTPATPYDAIIWDDAVPWNRQHEARRARDIYLRALTDNADRLAALDGVAGPVCPTCGGVGFTGGVGDFHDDDRVVTMSACPDCTNGRRELAGGSVAALVLAATEACDSIVRHSRGIDPEVVSMAVALGDALAAFSVSTEDELRHEEAQG